MPTAGSPAPTPPADGQEPQQEASATTRLLKAQAAELAALRRRVEGLPEPEQLAELKAKAERFDALSQRLPQLQQQMVGMFEQQQQAQQQQRLSAAIASAFTAAGGLPSWAEAFAELHGKAASFDGSGQVVMAGPDGNPVPIAQVLDRLRVDQQWSHTFRPSMGSGSGLGGPSPNDPRTAHGGDLSRLSTRQKFDLAFGGAQ